MRTRVLIAALLVGTTLVVVFYLASSYLALSYAVSALPKTLSHARPVARTASSMAAVAAMATVPAGGQAETDGEHAMHAAMETDPDIAALVDDRDPKVSGAIRAFFDDKPTQ